MDGVSGSPSREAGAGAGVGALTASAVKRNLSFADQHGHDLHCVRTSDQLHYSEGALHADWEGASGARCVIA
jgi:hypothetical protein